MSGGGWREQAHGGGGSGRGSGGPSKLHGGTQLTLTKICMVAGAGAACRGSGSRDHRFATPRGKPGAGLPALDRRTDRVAGTLAGRQPAGRRRAGGRGPAALTAAPGVSLGTRRGWAADVISNSAGQGLGRPQCPLLSCCPPHFDCRQHELQSQPIVQPPHYTRTALAQRQKVGRQQSRFATPAARSPGRRHVAQRHPVQVWGAVWQPVAHRGLLARSFVLN